MTDTQAPDVVVTEDRVIYIRWSEDGQHIRKWDTKPFDGGEPMYSRSFLLSEERVEAAFVSICTGCDITHEEMRAALTAAIGEDDCAKP